MLSIPHMIVVFVIVLVVFGPNKLPELARGLGKLMAEFRKASADFKGAFEQEMRDMERQAMLAERKKQAEAAAASAAAAPLQAATLGTAVGAETPVVGVADTRATEALVVTPVVEAVARGESSQVADGAAGLGVAGAASGVAAGEGHSIGNDNGGGYQNGGVTPNAATASIAGAAEVTPEVTSEVTSAVTPGSAALNTAKPAPKYDPAHDSQQHA